jgi:hypothetical protein
MQRSSPLVSTGLYEIRRVHDAARGRARADHRVDLVDEEDGARLLLELGDHALETLLEIAAVLGAGDQRAHVERVDRAVGQHVGHLALDDHARQAFGNGGLADAGSPTYSGLFLRRRHRISMVRSTSSVRPISGSIFAVLGELVEVRGVLVERAAAFAIALTFASGFFLGGFLLGDLRQAMGDEIDHVEARDLGAIQQVNAWLCFSLKMAMSTLATPTSFLPEDCTWNTARWSTRWKPSVGWTSRSFVVGQSRRGAIEVFVQRVLELVEVRAAGPQDLAHLRGIEDGQQQVLDGQELVTRVTGLGKGVVQTEFELLG